MRTEFLIEIGFIFKTGEKGERVVEEPVQKFNWRFKLVGFRKYILIKTKDRDLLLKVKK